MFQVLAHVGARGPGVPAGAVRAQRRVLAGRVLARAAARHRDRVACDASNQTLKHETPDVGTHAIINVIG